MGGNKTLAGAHNNKDKHRNTGHHMNSGKGKGKSKSNGKGKEAYTTIMNRSRWCATHCTDLWVVDRIRTTRLHS